jgi:hypothetical protein
VLYVCMYVCMNWCLHFMHEKGNMPVRNSRLMFHSGVAVIMCKSFVQLSTQLCCCIKQFKFSSMLRHSYSPKKSLPCHGVGRGLNLRSGGVIKWVPSRKGSPQATVYATVPMTARRRRSCFVNGASWIPGALEEYIVKPRVIVAQPG